MQVDVKVLADLFFAARLRPLHSVMPTHRGLYALDAHTTVFKVLNMLAYQSVLLHAGGAWWWSAPSWSGTQRMGIPSGTRPWWSGRAGTSSGSTGRQVEVEAVVTGQLGQLSVTVLHHEFETSNRSLNII
jgi:hypothetical protein